MNAIRENAKAFASLSEAKLCAVVKANAYGHGAAEVVNALSGTADCFAVALIEEAVAVKTAACGKDILVFTPPLTEEEAFTLAVNGFVATVSDLWTAKLVSRVCARYALPLRVHLKANTGMNRYGMDVRALGKTCTFLRTDKYVRVTGIYSHLCECDRARAEAQKALFTQAVAVCRRYFPNVTAHLSATYGATLGAAFAFDMVRVGLGLYGYLPDGCESALTLRKAMTVTAKTIVDRKYVFGSAGYGAPLGAGVAERLSVYRFGYADGFLRRRENGTVGCDNGLSPSCMDVCVRRGKGKRGREVPVLTDADETATATGTISYEVLCAATRRAELFYEE